MGSSRVRNRAKHAVDNWPWYLSCVILIIGVFFYIFLPTTEDKAQHGDFLAGFASTLAFIWLIAGYQQQQKELSDQRLALADQAKSLKRTSEYELISLCIKDIQLFEQKLGRSETGPKSISEINASLTRGLIHWKKIIEGTDPQQVLVDLQAWSPLEFAAYGFINRYAASIHFLEKQSIETAEYPENASIYILTRQDRLKSIPLLSAHANDAILIAHTLSAFDPGMKLVRLSGLCAMALSTSSEVVKHEGLLDLKKEIESRGTELPPICRMYFDQTHSSE